MASPVPPAALFRRLLRSVDRRLTLPSARASAEAGTCGAGDGSPPTSSSSSPSHLWREYIIRVADRLEAHKAAAGAGAGAAGATAATAEAAGEEAMLALRDYVSLLDAIHENRALIRAYNRPGEPERGAGAAASKGRESAGDEAKSLARKLGFKLPDEE